MIRQHRLRRDIASGSLYRNEKGAPSGWVWLRVSWIEEVDRLPTLSFIIDSKTFECQRQSY
jgi:hypothetical protein